ncbi:MAG TPA: hypothetical protein VGP21_01460 [Opitutaceae bacterium]|nr:hypothetical protein [Opitutaceae bacterium]
MADSTKDKAPSGKLKSAVDAVVRSPLGKSLGNQFAKLGKAMKIAGVAVVVMGAFCFYEGDHWRGENDQKTIDELTRQADEHVSQGGRDIDDANRERDEANRQRDDANRQRDKALSDEKNYELEIEMAEYQLQNDVTLRQQYPAGFEVMGLVDGNITTGDQSAAGSMRSIFPKGMTQVKTDADKLGLDIPSIMAGNVTLAKNQVILPRIEGAGYVFLFDTSIDYTINLEDNHFERTSAEIERDLNAGKGLMLESPFTPPPYDLAVTIQFVRKGLHGDLFVMGLSHAQQK